ncbi:isochorismatase family protein [Chrysiogenes arsenatis]|uniref:isochorismatase family protein n=1 Tax=Chrysiogenes arsenatis TaxID=309797 RepID=UPI00040991BA|nr:isochorismatase family protein [Chrysiogenes arsenatis]
MNYALDRNSTLFMVIDIQGRLAQIINNRQEIIKNTTIMIQGCHILGVPVCYTEQYPKGLGATDPFVAEYFQPDDARFEKITFPALTEEVAAYLQEKNIRNIVIAGMETHICVFQTVRALLDAGYGVFLLKDAVGSRTPENFERGADLAKHMGAVVTSTETVLFDLLGVAGTPEFKAISQLVK